MVIIAKYKHRKMKKRIVFELSRMGLIVLNIMVLSCSQQQSAHSQSMPLAKTTRDTLLFTLIEAKSNKPMDNKEIDINYFGMVYDAPPNLEFIQKITTNSDGQFNLPVRIFGDREIGISCGKDYQMIHFGIRDSQFLLRKFNNRFREVISNTFYDLEKGIETEYIYHDYPLKDSIINKIKDIKLIMNDYFDFSWQFSSELREKQKYYSSHQREMWEKTWTLFQKANQEETNRFHQTHFWFGRVTICQNLFPLDAKTLFSLAKNAKEKEKKYFLLYTTCLLIMTNKDVDIKLVKEIENTMDTFYKENNDLRQQLGNDKPNKDGLWASYLWIQKYLKDKQ
jgi:hypothetical protein